MNTAHIRINEETLSEHQREQLQEVRKQFSAKNVTVDNRGLEVVVTYEDGETVSLDARQLRLFASELAFAN